LLGICHSNRSQFLFTKLSDVQEIPAIKCAWPTSLNASALNDLVIFSPLLPTHESSSIIHVSESQDNFDSTSFSNIQSYKLTYLYKLTKYLTYSL
jgi:hypothetical protein